MGATYSYGPVIFTPLGPTVVSLFAAEETEGFGQSLSWKICRYIFSILGGGGLSLPYSQVNTDGWRSRRRTWSRKDSAEIFSSSVSQVPHFSQIGRASCRERAEIS